MGRAAPKANGLSLHRTLPQKSTYTTHIVWVCGVVWCGAVGCCEVGCCAVQCGKRGSCSSPWSVGVRMCWTTTGAHGG